MIKARTYYDIVELDAFLAENYDEFKGTRHTKQSFHRAIQQGEYGQDTLVVVNLEEWAADLEAYPDDYEDTERGDQMRLALLGINLLVRDGHLPEQDEYTINIWW